MRTRISAGEVFDELHERLGLRWITGQRGKDRTLERSEQQTRRPSLAGYLNVIHPNKVQIIGSAELAWLDTLDARQRWETLEKIMDFAPMGLVITQNQLCPTDLRSACEESGTPLWVSPKRGHELLNLLQYHLALALAPRITLHGVFMEIYSIGVLITGQAGAGKSELALELISRGNGLVADDIVELYRISPDTVEGRCPAVLRDFLEVRGIGVLNIRTIFGETAVRPRKLLKLIVHLEDHSHEAFSELDRLKVDANFQEVLGVPIRRVTIPVAAGRNLAVLVEAAVRNFVLNQRGIDSTLEFIERQQRLMEEDGSGI